MRISDWSSDVCSSDLVTVVLFSLLILSFPVWGIGDIFRGGGQAQVVAQVGDTVIEQRAFSRELSDEINTLSRRLGRSEDHTSELQSLMRITYPLIRLKKHAFRTTYT